MTEIYTLLKLRHPRIIKIVGFNDRNDENPPSIFLPLQPTNLETAIKEGQQNDGKKCCIVVEVVLGMRYIHSQGFMHRDLKPSNIGTFESSISDWRRRKTPNQHNQMALELSASWHLNF